MFGYVLPKIDELSLQDAALYNTFYCGICKDISSRLGQFARFSTGYDMTFFALLLVDYMDAKIEFELCKCVSNPFVKRGIVVSNKLLNSISDVSVILAYHKIIDDIEDEGGIKNILAKKIFSNAYGKAKLNSSELDIIVSNAMIDIKKVENKNFGIDILAHPFASMLSNISNVITGGVDIGEKTNDTLRQLCYNIGKFVYFIDALDDIEEDINNKVFNAFFVEFDIDKNKLISRQEIFKKYKDSIDFCMNTTINRCIESFNNMPHFQCYTLLANIIHKGLRAKFAEIINSNKKVGAKASRQYMNNGFKRIRKIYKPQIKNSAV